MTNQPTKFGAINLENIENQLPNVVDGDIRRQDSSLVLHYKGEDYTIGEGEGGLFNYVINSKAKSGINDIAVTNFTVTRVTDTAAFADTFFSIKGSAAGGGDIAFNTKELQGKDEEDFLYYAASVKLANNTSGITYTIGMLNVTDAEIVPGTSAILTLGAKLEWRGLFVTVAGKVYKPYIYSEIAGDVDDEIFITDVFLGDEQVAVGTDDGFVGSSSTASATTVADSVQTTIAGISMTLPAGDYVAKLFAAVYDDQSGSNPKTSNASAYLVLHDGTTQYGTPTLYQSIANSGYDNTFNAGYLNYEFEFTLTGTKTLVMQGLIDGGTAGGGAATLQFRQPRMEIYKKTPDKVYVTNSRVEHLSNLSASTSGNATDFYFGANGSLVPAASSANVDVKYRIKSTIPFNMLDINQFVVSPGFNVWVPAVSAFPYMDTGTAKYGMSFEVVSSTEVDIILGGDGAAQGQLWSTFSTWRWKWVKSMNPSGVGVKVANELQLGAVSSYAPIVAARVRHVLNANFTIQAGDGVGAIVVTTGNTNRTITLPSAASCPGRSIPIKKADSGTGFVIVSGTVDGVSGFILYTKDGHATVMSDGTAWYFEVVPTERGFPTLTMSTSTNVATITQDFATFERFGPNVKVQFLGSITLAAASPTVSEFLVSLPIPSNLGPSDLCGHGLRYLNNVAQPDGINIFAEATSDRARCLFFGSNTIATRNVNCTFTYRII